MFQVEKWKKATKLKFSFGKDIIEKVTSSLQNRGDPRTISKIIKDIETQHDNYDGEKMKEWASKKFKPWAKLKSKKF